MTGITIILIYVLIFLAIYPFAIYPIILYILSKVNNRKIKNDEKFTPEITFLISAYNEELYIEKCINSIYNSEYPKDKITIFVGSDGSNDKTNSILDKLNKEHSTLNYEIFKRIGKNQVLNQLIKKANTELIYFLDGDMEIPSGTITKIVSYLADEKVGAAYCNIKMTHSSKDTGGLGEKLYQKFENFIRTKESQILTTVNSFGALLIRKSLISSGFPSDRILDDNYAVLNVSNQNFRVTYDNKVIINELRPKTLKDEFKRRIRIISAGLATFLYFKKALAFKKGYFSFFLYSHKIIRIFSPIYLILILCLSIIIEKSEVGKWLLMLQFLFYSSAFAGYALELLKAKIKIFKVPLFYLVMNFSFLLGIFRFLSSKQNSIWNNEGLEK